MQIIITPENWNAAERDIRESGILDVIHDDTGAVQTIITQKGVYYEFPPGVIKHLIDSGLMKVKIGRRVQRK